MLNFDIIVLLIVVFVIYSKLKSLLGTNPTKTTKIEKTELSKESADKIINIIMKEQENQDIQDSHDNPIDITPEKLTPIDELLAQIPNFNKARFINNSKKAFEIIITAFSKGDAETLEMLVNKKLYKKFIEIIEQRKTDNITAETDFIGFESAEILDVKITKTEIAKITVKFVSEQVNLLKNDKDEVIEGDENYIQKISDIWTFEKALTSTTPNWVLTSTKKQ